MWLPSQYPDDRYSLSNSSQKVEYKVWPAQNNLLARPRIRNLYNKFLLPQFHWIACRQALKTTSYVVNDVQVAIWKKRVSHSKISTHGLGFCCIRLDKGREIQEAVECIADLCSRQLNVKVTLRQAK